MNLNFCYKRDYANKSAFAVQKNKANFKRSSVVRKIAPTYYILRYAAVGMANWVLLKCLSIGLLVLVVLGAAVQGGQAAAAIRLRLPARQRTSLFGGQFRF